MKNIIFSILILGIANLSSAQATETLIDNQDNSAYFSEHAKTVDGVTYWCGFPIENQVKEAEAIFEGRILTDSAYIETPNKYAYHRVLILKQFKGSFISDTIVAATGGGGTISVDGVYEDGAMYGKKGDEAIFFVKSYGNIFHDLHGYGCGFLTISGKKDIKNSIYIPIEKAVGQPYVEVHPNTCATQTTK